MRTRMIRNDRGVALVFAIFSLVVVGALVAGSFFVGRVEQVAVRNTVWATQAAEAAESGISSSLVNMTSAALQGMPVWTEADPYEEKHGPYPVQSMAGLSYEGSVRRLNVELFMFSGTGKRVGGGMELGSASIAQLVRIAKPTISVNAAVTVHEPVKFNGNAFEVNGINGLPPGWTNADCSEGAPSAGDEDDVVGIRGARETGAESKDMDNIFGYPSKTVDYDPNITSETFQNFLDYTYATLASQPGVKVLSSSSTINGVAPVVDGSATPAVCDKSAPLNFGEPYRNPPESGAVTECFGYYPVVHGTGATTKFASGSRGQGILLVDGDLEIAGGFEWSGLIIVRGEMKVTGTGNKINGAILTQGVEVAGSIGGNATVQYSACAITNAIQGASVPRVLSRGWSQLFN